VRHSGLLALALLMPLTTGAQEQVAPPAPAAPREAKLPQPVERTLPNGLRVIVVPKHDVPLVSTRLMIKTGGAADPQARAGLARMTATVLTKGTKERSAEEIALGVEALGATLDSSAGWDSSAVDLSVMSANLAVAMDYVADVVRNPTFAAEELDRERQIALDELQVVLRQPRTLGTVVMSRLLFGNAPYGHNLGGMPATLEAISRDDLIQFHRAHYRPDNAVLVMAGDVKPDAAFALAQKHFESWPRSGRKTAASRLDAKPPKPRVVVVDHPEAGQAAVLVGRRGIHRTDAAYLPAMVTNSVLGGGYSARLNQEIRIRRGLSYGAGSSFDPRLTVGPFIARTETKNESAAEVAAIIVAEMNRLASTPVGESELTPRKAVLIGSFARSLETSAGIVDRVSHLALYDLPLAGINRYISGVQSVTAAQVQKFASASLRGDEVSIVIVGNAQEFIEPLRERYEQVEVIGIDEVDLGSAALRVRMQKK
jgi:zinc protease